MCEEQKARERKAAFDRIDELRAKVAKRLAGRPFVEWGDEELRALRQERRTAARDLTAPHPVRKLD